MVHLIAASHQQEETTAVPFRMPSHQIHGLGLLLLLLVAVSSVQASDPDMLQDVCVADMESHIKVNGFVCKANAEARDFKSPVLNKPGDTNNVLGSNVTAANVAMFPGLNTLGVSAARIDYRKGGLNPPHIHPRATEILFLQQGTLHVGFIDTNDQLFAQTIYPGDLFVFPRGLVHFQLNIGKGPAMAFASFNGQNPGTSQVAKALFASNPPVNDDVLKIAFQLYPDLLAKLRELIMKT